MSHHRSVERQHLAVVTMTVEGAYSHSSPSTLKLT